jgi:hypothetical protein
MSGFFDSITVMRCTAAACGILVADINHNGIVDNGAEMFGNLQHINNTGALANSGFAQLAGYDTNGDGKVDAADANFADIKVWQDQNQNGRTDAGELKTLTELGIASINTANVSTDTNTTPFAGASFQVANGNWIYSNGTYTLADGSVGTIADVGLGAISLSQVANDNDVQVVWHVAN